MIELALVPVYAIADSFAGGSLGRVAKRLDDKLPGRAAFWGALLGAGVGLLTLGPWGAGIGLAWLIYRTPPWKVFGGSATPVDVKEIAGTLLRHLLALAALPFVYWAGKDVLAGALAFGAFAVAATMLAAAYGRANRSAQQHSEPIDPQLNTVVELVRGALYGAAAWIAFQNPFAG